MRGLLRALGVTGAVRSPSYALIEPYSVSAGSGFMSTCIGCAMPRRLKHWGCAISSAATLVLVEWPERAGGALPPPDLQLTLQLHSDYRVAELLGISAEGQAWASAATTDFASNI